MQTKCQAPLIFCPGCLSFPFEMYSPQCPICRSVIDSPKVSMEPAPLVLWTIILELDFHCPTCTQIIKLLQLLQHQEGCMPGPTVNPIVAPTTQSDPVPVENPLMLPTPQAPGPATMPDPATPLPAAEPVPLPTLPVPGHTRTFGQLTVQNQSYFTVQLRTIQQSKKKLGSLLFISSLNNHRMVQLFSSKQVIRYI